ncbi:hypothetical protein QBC43DRAFT_53988 [Cladorrhinum sp. PSN259]|nr:hypothetical protein QBC43DRAFT_53988 [Cladorrhinum sp. PSN259]
MDLDSSNPFLKDGNPISPQPHPESRGRTWVRGWWLEVVGVLVSLLCTASILVILIVMDGQPLGQWKLPYLSLPTTLSIFTTTSKSAILFGIGAAISQEKWRHFTQRRPQRLIDLDLFDQASRGPQGSFFLLFKKPKVLASWGALATLLLLAVDPTVQQIIDLPTDDDQVDDGKASFGLAHNYSHGYRNPNMRDTLPDDSGLFRVEAATADVAMQGAMYRGLYNLDDPAVYNCNSNCTWPGPFFSLGFASTCLDVKEATLKASNVSFYDDSPQGTGGILTTPGNVSLKAVFSSTSWQPVVSVNSSRLLTVKVERDEKGVATSISIPPDIARMAVFRAPYDATNYNLLRKSIEIIECDIRLVVHRYSNVEVINNNFTIGSQETIALDHAQVTNRNESYTATFKVHSAPAEPEVPVMTVSMADLTTILAFLSSDRFVGIIYAGEGELTPEPQGISDAFLAGNISQSFENMAKSMTNQLRSTYDVTAEGTSIYQVITVKVRWFWIIPTLVTQVISVVFCFLVILKSSRSNKPGRGIVKLWKDSTLAVLTHSVAGNAGSNGLSETESGHSGAYISSSKVMTDIVTEIKADVDTAAGVYINGPKVTTLKELKTWGEKVEGRIV